MLPSSENAKVYKVFGKIQEEHLRLLSPPDSLFPNILKCHYEPEDNVTLLEFLVSNDHGFVEATMNNLRDLKYEIDSKLVTPYKQMPYEPITKDEYLKMIKVISPVQWETDTYSSDEMRVGGSSANSGVVPNELKFCDGDKCIL